MGNKLKIAVILAIAFTSCTKNKIFTGLNEMKDIPYGTNPRQKLDIYLPEQYSKSTKVILLIHGGGWIMGNKEDNLVEASYLAHHGYVAASMSYRYASNKENIHYRALMEDVGSAIQCILNKASALGFDSSGIALGGGSAGGHMALLYAYGYDSLKQVKAVISMFGPTDISATDIHTIPGMGNLLAIMTGDTDKTHWADANPMHFVNSACPPTILFHGKPDNVVPVSQSVKMHQALDDVSVPNQLVLFEKSGHGFNDADLKTTLEETVIFLGRYFHP